VRTHWEITTHFMENFQSQGFWFTWREQLLFGPTVPGGRSGPNWAWAPPARGRCACSSAYNGIAFALCRGATWGHLRTDALRALPRPAHGRLELGVYKTPGRPRLAHVGDPAGRRQTRTIDGRRQPPAPPSSAACLWAPDVWDRHRRRTGWEDRLSAASRTNTSRQTPADHQRSTTPQTLWGTALGHLQWTRRARPCCACLSASVRVCGRLRVSGLATDDRGERAGAVPPPASHATGLRTRDDRHATGMVTDPTPALEEPEAPTSPQAHTCHGLNWA
jgi:hypothetical protein